MMATVEFPEVHEFVAGHAHGREDAAGYLVVRTDWSEGHPARRDPLAYFEIEPAFRAGEARYTDAYGRALACVKAAREVAGKQQYAVIDTIYDCGCRVVG